MPGGGGGLIIVDNLKVFDENEKCLSVNGKNDRIFTKKVL